MRKDIEWIVSRPPVPNADRPADADATPPASRARIAELTRQVRDGAYDNVATMDAVARRILQSGDL
jgi:hypothetical protein